MNLKLTISIFVLNENEYKLDISCINIFSIDIWKQVGYKSDFGQISKMKTNINGIVIKDEYGIQCQDRTWYIAN